MKIRMYPALFTGFLFSFFVYANGQTVDAVTTITWPHDTPDDPVATYSENTGDYFKPDYVSLGSNLNYLRVRESNGETFRTYQPNSQTGSGPDNVIGFHIWPVTGLSFTPTHVSFKAQRYGTDSGLLDVKWKSSDGTGVVIATALKPARDNSGSFTSADYDLSGLTIPASDGECALQIILYDLGNTKEVGLADIVLTGTISGTIIQVTTY
ncbi:MAG: hypothetical protein JXA39_08730, partial [Bacteroidales bacterium]|nr:hypothetical protein [Bacteroidales bacterium]